MTLASRACGLDVDTILDAGLRCASRGTCAREGGAQQECAREWLGRGAGGGTDAASYGAVHLSEAYSAGCEQAAAAAAVAGGGGNGAHDTNVGAAGGVV